MSGFCGNCGTPRVDGARFCMACGHELPAGPRLCPTCGQEWPVSEPVVTAPVAAPMAYATAAAPVTYGRGAYASDIGTLYFDGAEWYHARALGEGLWVPDPQHRLYAFDPSAAGARQLQAEATAPVVTTGLPRGPALGPAYDPLTDCGNCGFPLESGSDRCGRCGTSNTGAVFRPGG